MTNIIYQLYTLPTCCKCSEIEVFLKEKNIPYEKINLTTSVGREGYKKAREQLGEDAFRREDGMLLLPILMEVKGSKIERIVQETGNIKKYLESK